MVNNSDLESIGISKNNINETNNKVNKTNNSNINNVAKTIKTIAIIEVIISCIYGVYSIDKMNSDAIGIGIIVAGIVSSVFIYAFGEIIQLLEDIKNK